MKHVWPLVMICTLGAGCAGQAPVSPAPPLPAAFEHASTAALVPAPAAAIVTFPAFNSAELARLLTLADRDSTDLAAAIARVRQADAHAREAGAALLPELGASADATQFAGSSHGRSAHELDWSAVLTASFEIDFWGRNRATRDAALALAAASRTQWQTARITVLSGVIDTYLQLQSIREHLRIARLNLAAARSVLGFIQARYQAGAVGPLEPAQQNAAVANAELTLPPLRQQETAALTALAVLVGRVPEGFSVAEQALETLEEPAIEPGLPAELLARRPDLQTAESNLRAAHGDLAAARAALFPTFGLTVNGGVANPAVQAAVITLAGSGLSLTAGANLVETIFDNGRRRAVIEGARAREGELLAEYRGAIHSALADVENSLADIGHLDEQRPSQEENVRQSERAYEGARLRYQQGSGQYLAVLETQRTLYAAREQMSDYKVARLRARLSLSKALGGDWSAQPPDPNPASTTSLVSTLAAPGVP